MRNSISHNTFSRRAMTAVMAATISVCMLSIASAQGLVGSDGNFIRQPAEEQSGNVRGGSVSSTRTIEVNENGRDILIAIAPNGHIRMRIKRTYRDDELDIAVRKAPELEQAVRNFPSTVGDGETKVQVLIAMTNEYEATDAFDLQDRHPAAYELFTKFLHQANEQRRTRRQQTPQTPVANNTPPRQPAPQGRRNIGPAGGGVAGAGRPVGGRGELGGGSAFQEESGATGMIMDEQQDPRKGVVGATNGGSNTGGNGNNSGTTNQGGATIKDSGG